MPSQVALAERAAAAGGAAGADVVRAALPPAADLTEAAAKATKAASRPALVAGEELLMAVLERVQPALSSGATHAGRPARAAAVRVSAGSPSAEKEPGGGCGPGVSAALLT